MNLKELSKALGLSQTTVSRALNGYPEVSEATRKRVTEAARSYNYTPSSRAKALATGRAFAVGHVISIDKFEMVNPIYGDFLAGAGETYAANDYEMVLSVVGPDRTEAEVFEDLKRRRAVDGIVLQGPRHENEDRIALLRKIDMPFVVHGRASGETAPYSWVDVNNRAAFEQAVDHLTGLGHRRIGLINGTETLDFAHRRRGGFEAALARAGIAPDPDLMAAAPMTEDHGYSATRRFLGQATPPTGIVVSSILSAIGVRRAIGEAGLAIGRDVSVVVFDDMLSYLQNTGEPPYFTALQSSVRHAGRELADMLLTLIDDPRMTPQQKLLDAKLIPGLSTGPAP